MAHAHTADDELLDDPEVRDSIMIIKRQRNAKRIAAIAGIVGFFTLLAVSVYFAYASEMDSTKDLPTQTR